MTDFVAFEYLCCDLLANYGRFAGLVPQGGLRIPLDGEYQRLRRQYLGIDYDQHVFAPLETILAIPDRHPNRNDFECHAYYNDSILQHRIRALLEKNGSVLFWENLDVVRPH